MSRRTLHRGRVGDFGIETVTLPNGAVVDLEILRHPGAAAVVPLHDDGTVTLILQHRHAAGGLIWEIPAGKLDAGEDPADSARRELEEEAGLRAGAIRPLPAIWTTPAFTDEVIHLFVATELSPVPARLEHDEVITTARIPLEQARRMVREGEIRDAKTICALMLC